MEGFKFMAEMGASMASEKLASRGGFNAAALAGLLSNEDIQSRIATSTRQTAENTRRLVESARNGGASFA
jgi:fructose-specific phosphotransferase system IIC component